MRLVLLVILSLGLFCPVASANKPADDSQRPELVIIGEPGNVLEQAFAQHDGLRTIRNNSLYTPLRLSDPLYKLRYASSISGVTPMVLLQRPGGGVIWASDMTTMPYSSDAIFLAIKYAYEQAKVADAAAKQLSTEDCPGGDCPLPNQLDAPGWNLNPFDFAKPKHPLEGWFSDTISWVMIIVGVAVALGFVLIFGLIALGVVLLLNRFMN